jgi:integrase
VVAKDRRLVFHSFRHGFKDRATEAKIDSRVTDQICGHAPTTVGGGYGTGVRLPALRKALHRVDWRFLDWDRLAAGMKAMDWAGVAAQHHRKASR